MCSITAIDDVNEGCLIHPGGAVRDVDGIHKAISFIHEVALVTLMKLTKAVSFIQAVPFVTLKAFIGAVSFIHAVPLVTLMTLLRAVSFIHAVPIRCTPTGILRA